MFGKIISFLVIIFTVMSLICSFIYFTKKLYRKVVSELSKLKNIEYRKNFMENIKIFKDLIKEDFKPILPKLFIRKSLDSIIFTAFAFAISFVILIVDTPIESKMPTTVNFFLAIVILVGLAKGFFYSTRDLFTKIYSWMVKLLVLFMFSISFLTFYLQSPDNLFPLFLSIVFSVVFSLVLISSVLRDFKSIIFQLLNIIIGFGLIFFVVGIGFGGFYLENNDIFNFYTNEEMQILLYNFEGNFKSYLFLIYKGLIPFYTFPSLGQVTLQEPITLILIFEYILGFLFNVIIIGFLISYFVSVIPFNRGKGEEHIQS